MPITGAPLPVNACFLAFPRNVIDGSLDVAVPAVNHFNSNLSDILLILKYLKVILACRELALLGAQLELRVLSFRGPHLTIEPRSSMHPTP